MSKIFLSYRRDDKDRVFMDVDTIEPGVDFERVIEKAVGECDVLVAVIGKRWMGGEASDSSRLDNPKDYVRLEISTALARDIRVIPLLVDGTTMPSDDVLPAPLRPITRRHAIELSNTRFSFDVERLITAIRRTLGEGEENQGDNTSANGGDLHVTRKRKTFQPPWLIYGIVAAGLVVIVLSLVFWWAKRERPEQDKGVSLPPQNRLQPRKETESRDSVRQSKEDQPIATRPVLAAGKVFRDRLKSGGEGPEMVVIPAGSFQMGDVQGGGDKDELPVRTVRIQNPFAIGRYEATFGEYDQFTKATNRQFASDQAWGRGRRPVIFVSWQDAVEYAKWLSLQSGKPYRLPTEAEWEYAARAGNPTAYWWGKDWVRGMANCSGSGCGSQWGKKTAPVGSFKPNPFGLYDTAGNVWEWVEECWHDNYSGAPTDGSAWTSGGNCARRVIRGGSWENTPRNLRSSKRGRYYPENRDYFIGFRLVQEFE